MQVQLGNTNTRQINAVGYAKQYCCLCSELLVFSGFHTDVLIRRTVFENMLTEP